KYEEFENCVRLFFGRTVNDYKRLMGREMLADRMRSIVTSNVRVSEDEVWLDYDRRRSQVSIRYIQFSPEFYRNVPRDDDEAALNQFAQSHETEIQAQWEAR